MAVAGIGKLERALHNVGVDLTRQPVERALLLFVLPSSVAGIQIGLEIRAARNREKAKLLARKNSKVPSGYFRIGPYGNTEQDRKVFKRTDLAHERVLKWIKSSKQPVLYLTGDSGCGKSSLLEAYVIPTLQTQGWNVLSVQLWDDPIPAICATLNDGGESIGSKSMPHSDLIGALIRRSEEQKVGLLIVIDQFEQYIILSEAAAHSEFSQLLVKVSGGVAPRLKILIALRSDYMASLDDMQFPALRQGENWQQVGRFSHAASMEFMKTAKLGLSVTALETLVCSASSLDDTPGLTRPITLNVVGFILGEGPSQAVSLDVGVLVQDYIRQTVSASAVRDFAPAVLEYLITEQGTKLPRSELSLAKLAGLRLGEVRAVLNALADAGLARPLDSARGLWELSHDFIARTVVRFLGRQRPSWRRTAIAYSATIIAVSSASVAGAIILSQPRVTPPLSKPFAFFSGNHAPPLDEMSHVPGGHLVGHASIVRDPDPSQRGNVFYFPPEGGYFQADPESLPRGDQDRTVALWVYTLSFLPDPYEAFFVGYGHFRHVGQAYFLFADSSSNIGFSTWGDKLTALTQMEVGKWYFLTVTSRRVESPRHSVATTLYLNGEFQNSEEVAIDTITTLQSGEPELDAKLLVGELPDDGTDRTMKRALIGFAKDLMIYERALTPSEIRWLYQHPGVF